MSDRPLRDRRPSNWLADFVVPVGGVRNTPPRNQTQRQRRQQSPVEPVHLPQPAPAVAQPVQKGPGGGGAVPIVHLQAQAPPVPHVGYREVAGTDGSQILLEDLLDPVVPGMHNGPVIEDADGWNKIDQWCVWECTLCEYPTMLDIPGRG